MLSRAALVFPQLLHPCKNLLVDNGRLGIGKKPLILWGVMQPLFQLVGFGIGLEVHRTAGVLWPLQYPRDRLWTPLVRLLRQRLSVPLGIVSFNRQNVLSGQQLGNLHGAFSCNAQVENPFDDLGGFLVHNPFLFIHRVFLIPVGRIGAEVFPGVSFGPHNSPDFLAGISGVEVVEQITKRGEIVVPLVAVHAVIDGDIPNIALGKETLGIVAHFQIVPAHAGHILDNDGSDLSRLGQTDHLIPTRTVKGHPGNTIVDEKRGIGETVVSRVL